MLNTRKIVITAVMSGLALALAYAVHLPIIPAAPMFEYDPADIPIFFVTYALGVPCGLIMTFIVSVIQGFTMSASGIIGVTMHIFATGSFVIISGAIYRKWHTRTGLFISAVFGVVFWVLSMIAWNIIFTPIFMGTPREAVYSMILPIIVPFNLFKSVVNSSLAIALFLTTYKIIERYLPPKTKIEKR